MKAFFCATALLTAVAHLATAVDLAVFEKLGAVPQGWKQGERVSGSKPIRFRLAIKQENAAAFEQHVIDISTPGHAKYGSHMSREELKRSLKPSEEATEAILEWLESSGIQHISNDGDWISFVATTEQAESMMDTEFHHYTNEISGMTAVRTLQYSVPEDITAYVQMIQPTIRFGQFNPQRSNAFKLGEPMPIQEAKAKGLIKASPRVNALNSTFCNTTITPDCLRELYHIGNYTADIKTGAKLGVAGYLEEYAKYDAYEQFLETYSPYLDAELNNFTYALINGGKSDQVSDEDDVEANLDIQYAIAMGANVKTTYYSTGGRGPLIPDLDQPNANESSNEPYLEFLHYILALPDDELPQTLTTSYGEDEQSVPESYTNSTCSMFAQLGARGVSILFSSGDTGVGSACQTNDGKNTTRFLPIFPAACPFVTSVGGTYHVSPEQAIAFSSGGFSDRFPRPAYQDAAVSAYLDILGDRWEGLYNPAGRGFPDIAAQSYNFSVIERGSVIPVGGTSASAPAVAGIVSLLNSARMGKGLKPLGFLNPWLYSEGYKGLTDIVDGGSRGCTGRDIYSGLPAPFVPYASWNATKGWDPVTGYGTPNFPALLELALTKKETYPTR